MKLVDILARELKVWPEGVVTAVQDLDGEVKFDNSHEMPRINKSKDVWIRQGDQGDCLYPKDLAEDCSYAIVTLPLWQAAVDALRAENCAHLWVGWSDTEACEFCNKTRKIVVEWNGEGLPPVGTVCEFEVENDDWRQCEVVAIKDDYAVCWIHVNKIFATGGAAVRPIRTPEQIAAEDRSKACDAIYGVLSGVEREGNRSDMAEALYDAGYRKF